MTPQSGVIHGGLFYLVHQLLVLQNNNDIDFDLDLDVIWILICDIALQIWCSTRKCLNILFKSKENNGWYFKINLDLGVISILIRDIN